MICCISASELLHDQECTTSTTVGTTVYCIIFELQWFFRILLDPEARTRRAITCCRGNNDDTLGLLNLFLAIQSDLCHSFLFVVFVFSLVFMFSLTGAL